MSESTLFIDPAGTSKSWAWAASGNYWGNRSDGELVTSGDVSFAVPVDGPVVVKQFSSLTINAGDTVTTANRCRGLVIYVEGDATINGTLTMTARGANVDPALPNSIPASGIRLARRKSGGPDAVPHSDLGGEGAGGVGPTWKAVEEAAAEIYPHTLSDGMIYVVARSGGIGGGRRGGSAAAGFSGNRGLNGTGGGGGGANDDPGTSGAGATGTCYSGGSGGGANHDGPGGAANAGANGGAGGAPSGLSNGGGAGNPSAANAETGTGGLLVIFVRGKLTVGSGGRVSSNGSAGGDSFTAGGGSGGGRVIVLYGGEFLKQGVIEASGGKGGTGAVWAWGSGGAGGDGEVTIDNIDP